MNRPSEMEQEPLWTTKRVAAYYQVTAATVRGWVRKGWLSPAGRRPGRRGAWLFRQRDALALSREGEEIELMTDVEAIINCEMNRVRGR